MRVCNLYSDLLRTAGNGGNMRPRYYHGKLNKKIRIKIK